MKKFFLTAFVILACVVNAAKPANEQVGVEYIKQGAEVTYKYTWGTDRSNNQILTYEQVDAAGNNISGWKYENGKFTFTSDYVWTDFASRVDVRNGKQVGEIVEFGYYKIVDGQPTATHAMMTVDGTDVTKNTVIFEKDDTIGFYAKLQQEVQTRVVDHYEHTVGFGENAKTYTSDHKNYYLDEDNIRRNHNGTAVYKTETINNTYTTTPDAIEGATVVLNNADTNSRGNEDQFFCLFPEKIDNVSHFEYHLVGLISSDEGQSYDDFYKEVVKENPETNITDSDGNPATSGGQPLPGLLMTLAIGGTAVAGLNKKRKK